MIIYGLSFWIQELETYAGVKFELVALRYLF